MLLERDRALLLGAPLEELPLDVASLRKLAFLAVLGHVALQEVVTVTAPPSRPLPSYRVQSAARATVTGFSPEGGHLDAPQV